MRAFSNIISIPKQSIDCTTRIHSHQAKCLIVILQITGSKGDRRITEGKYEVKENKCNNSGGGAAEEAEGAEGRE